MANVLQNGAKWLVERLGVTASQDAIYYRKDNPDGIAIRAIKGQLTATLEDVSGFETLATLDNFIVCREYLSSVPDFGDIIQINSERYEVSDTGMGVWRYTDPYRTAYRIFTRRLPDALEGDTNG